MMTIIPQIAYKFNVISIKLHKNRQTDPKIGIKVQRTKDSQYHFSKAEQS